MAKPKQIYVCTSCGQVYSKWQGKCDGCKEWNTIIEQAPEPVRKVGGSRVVKGSVATKRLIDVSGSTSERIITNISEFNRVMGGGIVKDSMTIITARPGAGKSTLLLQVAQDIASQGLNVLYASGEESEGQIKNRAERILDEVHPNIWIHSDISMNNVLAVIEEVDADLIIVDSIQTFIMEEHSSGGFSFTQGSNKSSIFSLSECMLSKPNCAILSTICLSSSASPKMSGGFSFT